jgi:DNA-binding PadR family transcriptional regulator
MTGYEINKLVTEGCFSHFIEASYGSIYPALTKLVEEGFVTFRTEHQDGKPARKVYSITDEGQNVLFDALHEIPKPDVFKSEFLFICLYSEWLKPAHINKVLDLRIQFLEEALSRFEEMLEEDCYNSPGNRFAVGYGIAVKKAALDYIKVNRHKIEKHHGHNADSAYVTFNEDIEQGETHDTE